MTGRFPMRSEAVTLPDVDREANTLPPGPLADLHTDAIELMRRLPDVTSAERALLIAFAECFLAHPLEGNAEPTWTLHVVIDGRENWRSGGHK